MLKPQIDLDYKNKYQKGLVDWSGYTYDKYWVSNTVSVGTNPYGCFYNPTLDRILVTNYSVANSIMVDTNGNITSTITTGTNPSNACYIPTIDRMAVLNYGNNNMMFIGGI